MANTKVLPSKRKVPKSFSVEKMIFEDFLIITSKKGVSPSVIVNDLIAKYVASNKNTDV